MDTLKHLFDLSGKTALIADGSYGLGPQIAETLGGQDARIILSVRKANELKETQAHLESPNIEVDWIAADGVVEVDTQCLADEALVKLGHADVLVNSAGATWGTLAEDYPAGAWGKVMNLNIHGLFLLIQQIDKRSTILRKYGKIVNVASIVGPEGNPPGSLDTIAYNTSKGVVVNFIHAPAGEWGGHDIIVNIVTPGFLPSKMARGSLEKLRVDKLAEHLPLHRIDDDGNLKNVAALLVSDASKHITGQIPAVDGGVSVV